MPECIGNSEILIDELRKLEQPLGSVLHVQWNCYPKSDLHFAANRDGETLNKNPVASRGSYQCGILSSMDDRLISLLNLGPAREYGFTFLSVYP